MSEYRWKPFTLLVSADEVKGNEMKIEAGKYYKTRDGRKVGPITWNGSNFGINFNSTYYSDGRASKDSEFSMDLISEWQDEAPSPIRTVTRREIVPGLYGRVFINDYDPLENTVSLNVKEDFGCVSFNAEELREAAHLLNQIAEVLEENGK